MANVLSFLNSSSCVGKTSSVYHLAWIFAGMGRRVVVIDSDPQSDLTRWFLGEDEIECLWGKQGNAATIYQCVKRLIEDDDVKVELKNVGSSLYLLPGDIKLSFYEDVFFSEWLKDDKSLFRQVIQKAIEAVKADIVLIDTAPNVGAINRTVFTASDYFIVPLSGDPVSLFSLQDFGETLRKWRKGRDPRPVGYLYCSQKYLPQEDFRVPEFYRKHILNYKYLKESVNVKEDIYCMGVINHYFNLMDIARSRKKPIFDLEHHGAAKIAQENYCQLAEKISQKMRAEWRSPQDWVYEKCQVTSYFIKCPDQCI